MKTLICSTAMQISVQTAGRDLRLRHRSHNLHPGSRQQRKRALDAQLTCQNIHPDRLISQQKATGARSSGCNTMADTTAVGQQPLCVLQRLQPVLVVTAWTLLRQVLRSVVLQTLHIAVHVAHLLASPVLPVLRAHQSQLRLPRRTPGDALLQRYLHHQQARMQQTAVSPRAPPQQAAGRRSWPLSVVLDLDETLVWCRRPSEDGSQPAVPLSRGSFEVECELSSGRRGCLTVVKRPGVTEFLHRVSAFADITVFTASTPGYAQPVLDALDPTGQLFAACLFRNSTSKTRHHENVKDLSQLGKDLARVILVDNDPFSCLMQPQNGLPVRPFEGDLADDQLLTVVLPILEGLASFRADIRPVLDAQFRMAAWLQRRMALSESLQHNSGTTCV